MYGARISLSVGFLSQGIALAIGLSLGLVSGFYGKWVDETVMRLADVTLAFPSLLLLIALAAAFEPSLTTVLVTIGVVGWAGMARIVRGQVLVVRQLEYVQAARALGERDYRIITRHLLPNCIAPVVIAATLGVAGAIDGGGGAIVPGARCAAADAQLGIDRSRTAAISNSCDTRRGRRSAPGWPIGAAVLGFTCSATRCVTRSIRAHSRDAHRDV